MNVYFDSSALVKKFVIEPGSEAVLEMMEQADILATGLLSRAEVSAALAKAVRIRTLSRNMASDALDEFRMDWPNYVCITANNPLIYLADRLAWDHGLRGYDAVHLASALTWQSALGSLVIMATYDKQLWQAARTVALGAWPDRLN